MKLYIVEAQFSSYDSFYELVVGIFDDVKIASYHKDKWDNFFKTKFEEIFKPYVELRDKDEDGLLPDDVETEWYRKQAEFRMVFDYHDILIKEWNLNEDWFNHHNKSLGFQSQKIQDMMKTYSLQEDREMNINQILK